MMPLRYLQMDVFADRPGAGNALGAVFDAAHIEPSRMAAGLAVHAGDPRDGRPLVVRAFRTADDPPEDPVTGRLPGRDGRDGRAMIHVDDGGDVWLGGHAQPVIRDEVRW